MRVVAVRGSDFRCYERVAVELPAGLVGVVGPNGAGKTALIEMIHFGCLGYSPRTTSEGQVVRFGAELLRVETDVLVVRRAGLGGDRLPARASPSACR